jgi:cytoplasmic iron level regulating protein YaaA (DUF328/UPF0246 family)
MGNTTCKLKSAPALRKQTSELLPFCKKLSVGDLKKSMSLSDDLAKLNVERFRNFERQPSKQACLAMDGPAFRGLSAGDFTEPEQKVAQNSVRILSGLYGLLRPYDSIQPYRLEMGSKLATSKGKSLYDFWGEDITEQLVKEMNAAKANILVNCASQEYWKSLKLKALPKNLRVVTCDFPGPSVFAKKARGLMCRYIVKAKVKDVEGLKKFKGEGEDVYEFSVAKSKLDKLVFIRQAAGKPAGGAKKRPAAAEAVGAKRTRK